MVVMHVVGTPPTLSERADALVFPEDSVETVAAILQRVCDRQQPSFRERSDGPALINALSIEASRIAQALAKLAAEQTREPGAVPAAVDVRLVRRLIKLRRDRDRHFPAEIFADPAWDMLLDLSAARLEGSQVSVSSLCIASAVPTTTALRWIRSLTEAGIFVRATDPMDARRTWIALSDSANEAMMAWLRRVSEQFAANS